MNDLEHVQKLEITRLEQQLVSLIEASSGRNNPDSHEARAGILNSDARDVTLQDLLAASRASSVRQEKKQKLDEATWGSELRGLYQNQGHYRRESEASSNDDIPSPIADTEGMYFLLHGQQPEIGSDTSSQKGGQREVKKLHFSKKIKKREKQELNFTLESLERLVIHPDFRSNITSKVNTPPGEKQPQVNEYNQQITQEQKKTSLSSNAFIDPFITRQQTTLDAKVPSLSTSKIEKKQPLPKEMPDFGVVLKQTKVRGEEAMKVEARRNKMVNVVLKQRETPLQSMSKREQKLLIEELEHKFEQSVRKQIPTPKQVMLKLPIRSPTTPEPGPLPPLIQERGKLQGEDRAKEKKKGGNPSLLQNYMKRLERKPKSRNLGQPQFGHKSMIGSSGGRSTASQSFIRHC